MKLYLHNRDELYIIDLEQVLCFEAEDHYAHIYYASGYNTMIPFSLSTIESHLDSYPHIIRAGRGYLVNTKQIFRLNRIKQTVAFLYTSKENLSIKLSKEAIKIISQKLNILQFDDEIIAGIND